MFDARYRSSEVLVIHLRDYMGEQSVRGIDTRIRFAPKSKTEYTSAAAATDDTGR